MLSHILYCNDSLLIPLVLRQVHLFQAWTWQLTMLQIYVTLWGRWCVCVCVCVCVRACVHVCVSLLRTFSHFLPIKINLTNILPILIKIVDFKNLASMQNDH